MTLSRTSTGWGRWSKCPHCCHQPKNDNCLNNVAVFRNMWGCYPPVSGVGARNRVWESCFAVF